MKFPQVSVVIATYNSAKTLPKVLRSIRNQNYPKTKVEILIIDGNSNDETLKIAKQFNCKIFINNKRNQVYGKFLGYKKSKGDYIMLIDSDEELINKNSIRNKVSIMENNKSIKAVISSGYRMPKGYPDITDYLNEFGDPFSFYMYKSPRNEDAFLTWLISKYRPVLNDKEKAIFNFNKDNTPFIELTSMGVILDKNYIKRNIASVFKLPSEHTHIFYLLNKNKKSFAVTKNDAVVHYSVNSFSSYLRKIRSRITSNIFKTEMGKAGFSGREKYSKEAVFKKYSFLIYGFSIFLPLLDGLYLALTRKKTIYLMHAFLTYYTLILIVFFYTRKKLHLNTKLYTYGEK